VSHRITTVFFSIEVVHHRPTILASIAAHPSERYFRPVVLKVLRTEPQGSVRET